MNGATNKILTKMLDRLFAGLVSGPNMNCRPHASRQRVDWLQLEKFDDLAPAAALGRLLGDDREVKLSASAPMPKRLSRKSSGPRRAKQNDATREADLAEAAAAEPEIELTPEEKAAEQAWRDQQAIIGKLRILVDDARTYEQDTGVHVLNVGFPLLSLPPGAAGSLGGAGGRAVARRLLAPIAFVPVTITLRGGATQSVTIDCKGDGVDLVVPNMALVAWLERQTGKSLPELFSDEQGQDPWREINEIVRHVAGVLDMPAPEFGGDWPLDLKPAPRADDEEARPQIVAAAVLGLFPMNNQGLLRDMQAMAAGESLGGPVQSFIDVRVSLDATPDKSYEHEAWSGQRRRRTFADERFVTVSDPCQSRAVRFAREHRGLVIHGPPGTGKSQTITNIIGDHLARGERVLMVCDKRTAMDVVANRLEHMGLGSLCALIHDPQRDQRDLYRAIRDQLEQLTEAKSDSTAERKIARIDAELERLHAELTEYWSLLMQGDGDRGASFHELVGEWLGLAAPAGVSIDASSLAGVSRSEFETNEQNLADLFKRAERINYGENLWSKSATLSLDEFLARPMDAVRRAVQDCVAAAAQCDTTADAAIPRFAPPATAPLTAQAQARAELATQLEEILHDVDPASRERWGRAGIDAIRRMRQKLASTAPFAALVRRGPLDAELESVVDSGLPSTAEIAQQLGAVEAYLAVASRWYGLFCWRRRAKAVEVLGRYGLPPGRESAARLREFLAGLRARLALSALRREFVGQAATGMEIIADEILESSVAQQTLLLDCLAKLHTEPALGGLAEPVTRVITGLDDAGGLIAGLRRSSDRVAAIVQLEQRLGASGLVDRNWTATAVDQLCAGTNAVNDIAKLEEQLDSLDDVLRVRHALAALPAGLRPAVESLLGKGVPANQAVAALRQGVLAAEIDARLRSNPKLQSLDAQRMRSSFERYRALNEEKRGLVRDAVLHRWISRQQERLLARTGSRLNGVGADLRRRLTLRGERAMRLRQVIAVGQGLAADTSEFASLQSKPQAGDEQGDEPEQLESRQEARPASQPLSVGDPLFDARPVWLASPETVAQIFPRIPLFDVVIFDEASQCRLEEALPVLVRAKRVVIAGDPKQLPPTRFFETALATSEDEEAETEQQLFEQHQGEIEDLLGAALSIDIEQCYLDVHYRSRNSDLIEFSNEQFYSSRLQPIPGHPNNRSRFAPITLYRANGLYDKRTNPAEADAVCRIVADLLKRAEPPSIGIACFNIAQRDSIVERLDELAAEDDEFAVRLADARTRRGAGTFEGLFVKNLENVQGDERDHMIISTTYGPDPKGRFYRRFGPVGRAGGGRRLNVLVTRAREEVHLVTSIPAAVYRSVPPVPAGQVPGGGWLLFSYLAYAERLAEEYEAAHEAVTAAEKSKTAAAHVRPSRSPSEFAAELAKQLAARHNTGSDVHWGNDGFCVDLALHHPTRVEDVTIGVLCDGTRFAQAEDPIEWDAFRTAVLESQGWQLQRLWTPQFFRDPDGCAKKILREAAELVAKEDAKDGLKVVKTPDAAS